jgi:hypothetical protein
MPNPESLSLIAVFIGSLLTGMAGWWDAHEPFDPRKFLSNVWRSIFAVATYALAIQSGAISVSGGTPWLAALVYGAATEGVGSKVQGAIQPKGPTLADKVDQLQKTLEQVMANSKQPQTLVMANLRKTNIPDGGTNEGT